MFDRRKFRGSPQRVFVNDDEVVYHIECFRDQNSKSFMKDINRYRGVNNYLKGGRRKFVSERARRPQHRWEETSELSGRMTTQCPQGNLNSRKNELRRRGCLHMFGT